MLLRVSIVCVSCGRFVVVLIVVGGVGDGGVVGDYIGEFTWVVVEVQILWSIGFGWFVEALAGGGGGVLYAVDSFAFQCGCICCHGCGLRAIVGTLGNGIVDVWDKSG